MSMNKKTLGRLTPGSKMYEGTHVILSVVTIAEEPKASKTDGPKR